MRSSLIALLLAVAPLSAQAQPILQSTLITPPAQLIRNGAASALPPRKAIESGDTIRTGARGSAGLQLAGDSVVTLGDSSELFVHSVDGANPDPLLRLQLLRGDLQLEAYPPPSARPHDYRINLGPLHLRALGADLWAYVNNRGEGVCLHQGAVEITGTAGAQRLDVAGDCVQHDAARGTLQLLEHAEAQIKDDLLDDRAGGSTTAITHAATAPAPPQAGAAGTRWTVVLASLPERAGAEQAARELQRRGVHVDIVETSTPRAFRVVSGAYRIRGDATRAAVQLRKQHHFKNAWVAANP